MALPIQEADYAKLREDLVHLCGNARAVHDASIVIPVNAQGDLENVLTILRDIAAYDGENSIEIILVINNYDAEQPPAEIELYSTLGLTVVSVPNARQPGEAAGFSARIPGLRAASSETVILFDADCRIPHPTALLDWYIDQFQAGADLAYTHVDYYGLRDMASLRLRMLLHHGARWIKRAVFRIPTNRGSNYTVRRSLILQLYDESMLADEMNVGPNVKARGGRIAYSGAKQLLVLTSGRMFSGRWSRLIPYFFGRLWYNLRVLPVRRNAARFTHRENDPVRKYVSNVPVN